MNERFTLLVLGYDLSDATSFYRALGPLAAMKRQCDWLHIQTVPQGAKQFDWAALAGVDGVFIQRPSTASAIQLAARAKLHGIPVWIDFDDALGHVPNDNPATVEYEKQSTQRLIGEALRLADFVSVSTPLLRELVEEDVEIEVRVIPNALMDFFVGPMKERRDQQPVIAWRGSDTHQRDLMMHASDLVHAAGILNDASWFFLGWNPWFVTEQLDPEMWKHEPLTGVVEYFHRLRELSPKVMIAPLADNIFNRAKSSIAWLEATWAGAVVVANDLPEWNRPGVFRTARNLVHGTYFGELIGAAYLGNESAHVAWQLSKAHIEKHYLIDHVNQQRFDVLEGMKKLRSDKAWVTKTMRSVPLLFERG